MPAYFVDTSFWIALLTRMDDHHARAVAWRKTITKNSAPLITTHAILWETANALSYKSVRAQSAVIYRRCFEDAAIETVDFSPEWNQAAMARFESRPD